MNAVQPVRGYGRLFNFPTNQIELILLSDECHFVSVRNKYRNFENEENARWMTIAVISYHGVNSRK